MSKPSRSAVLQNSTFLFVVGRSSNFFSISFVLDLVVLFSSRDGPATGSLREGIKELDEELEPPIELDEEPDDELDELGALELHEALDELDEELDDELEELELDEELALVSLWLSLSVSVSISLSPEEVPGQDVFLFLFGKKIFK